MNHTAMNSTRTERRRWRRIGAAAAATTAVLLAAACGTTVRNAHALLSQQGQAGYGATTGSPTNPALPSPIAGSSTPGQVGAVTPSTSSAHTGGSIPVPSTNGGSTAPGSTTPGHRGGNSTPTSHKTGTPGTHAKVYTGPAKLSPVEIGIAYSPDVGAFAKLFGATADVGNLQTDANATINYINKHGGLFGHVLSPVYYGIQLTSTQPYSTIMAAICSSWTQDHHVAAGIAVGFNIPNDLAECLSAKHIPCLSGGNYVHDATDYRQIPYLISPYEAGTDRVMTSLLRDLFAHHWLSSKSKVGVLLATNEPAATRAYNNVIVPTLKGRVASITSYSVLFPPSTTAAVATAQTISNDELHMRANGVTHVIFLAPGAEGSFIDDAYKQHWFPKYAITSYDTPWAATLTHTKEIGAALAGSIGIGWQPTTDVGTYGNSVFTNATTKLCKSILAPTGQLTSNEHEFAGYSYCDALLSVQAAANASQSATLTGPTMLAGYNALGTSHPDAMTFEDQITAQQHNGANAYRQLAFNTTCRCYRYTGGITNFRPHHP